MAEFKEPKSEDPIEFKAKMLEVVIGNIQTMLLRDINLLTESEKQNIVELITKARASLTELDTAVTEAGVRIRSEAK